MWTKITRKKEQNTQDMLAFMDSRKDRAQGIIDLYLEALADPEKIARSSVNNIATALGIVVDKFSAAGVVLAGTKPEDDPLTAAIRDEAERMENGNI